MNISYKDHVTNEEVRRKIQAAIGEYDELLTLVKKRKLRCFGHVSRSSGLEKTILKGSVKGKRKRGRQKKRWEDNIKEWTGSPPVIFIAGRPKAALLLWFFGDFRCGALLFVVIHVIYKYNNR